MNAVEIVDEAHGGVAHVYKGTKTGHRPDAECPCQPATPLTSRPDPKADLFVHRFMPQRGTLGTR